MDPALLEKKLATFRANNRSEALALNLRKGAAALCWGVLPGGSGPLLKLSFGNRAIYLDPSVNAAVTGCRIDDLEDILAGDSRGVLDEFHLYSLNENLSFRITEAKIADGNPTVRMTAVVPGSENADPNSRHPAGLEIEKILSLENGGTTIRSIYTLKNPKGNARAIKTGFRLKNYPRLGAAWNTGKALPSFWRIDIPGTRTPICFRGSNRPDNLVLCLFLDDKMQTVVIEFIAVDSIACGVLKSLALFQIEDLISQFESRPDLLRRIRKFDSVLILLAQNRRIAKFIPQL